MSFHLFSFLLISFILILVSLSNGQSHEDDPHWLNISTCHISFILITGRCDQGGQMNNEQWLFLFLFIRLFETQEMKFIHVLVHQAL